MKKLSLLPKILFLSCFCFIALSFVVKLEPTTVELNQAIKSNQITAEIISNGKYSGKSVELSLTNTSKKSLTIKIPAGSAYMPADDGEQTLIQLEEDMIVLKKGETMKRTIAAFCSEASDGCPSSSSAFSLSATTNDKLKQMIAYMKGKKISKKSYQDAVWAVTDGRSISNIQADDKVTKDFRQYVAKLLGKEDTWYTSPQQYSVDPRGNINSETVVISGELKFASDGILAIHEEVYDSEGNIMFSSPPGTPRKSQNVTMKFRIRVQGWEVGTYTVKVMEGDVALKSFPFEV
ncbi:MAG: hypothetical protein ACI837_002233 [Crocinitomicaceae bacterium]|jgi:hypothetical protein